MKTVPTILNDVYVVDQGNSASRAVTLLWPSLFTDHTMWRHQMGMLHELGWRTLAIDPPGHGKSPGPNRRFTMDQCAQAALQVLDALNVQVPVVVLGTSWGGMVAPRMALLAPQRLRGMALFNTTAERATTYDRMKNTLLCKMLAIPALDSTVDQMLLSLQLSKQTRVGHPEIPADLRQRFRSWSREGLITSVRSVLVDRDASLDYLNRVSTPALVVSGKEDSILPSPHAQRICHRLQNARHVEVGNAAHLVPLEVPERANALLREFLSNLAATHSSVRTG